ncbi:SH3 domain-containing protein [Pseudophaeobacter arcticus]|uniref:SH3 domain-containing protein n=1 Tax=Pseudophaeobacter arcticus TaxID=385492 RepID=UPI00248FB24B|nr:SH3 domain-containing protein [Pseudophaeobacter arcticus]
MSRLVIVSFAFLGWGFYELSGGGDFVAPERPPEPLAEINNTSAALPASEIAASTFQRSAKIRAASLVTAPVLQQASASTSQAETTSRPAPDPAHRQAVALDKIASAGASLQSSGSAFAPSAETGLLHMDNIQGGLAAMTSQPATGSYTGGNTGSNTGGLVLNTGLTGAEPAQPLIPAESYLDIREIRASRVNMRQGPGTLYPVTARLLAGDEVLIMEDSGTGWLQIRTRNGSKVGWVAASLVSKKRS